jgi:cold shock CspA family protein
MKSVLFQLMDVLIWFKMYVDSKPKKENWEKIENSYESEEVTTNNLKNGQVINLNQQKGFAFFKPDELGDNVFIPPHLVSSHSLQDEMPIQVEIEEYTDNRSGEQKTRVKRII